MSDSASEHLDEKRAAGAGLPDKHERLDEHQVDTAAALAAGHDETIDPEEAARLRRKIDWHLMPLMCILYLCVRQSPHSVRCSTDTAWQHPIRRQDDAGPVCGAWPDPRQPSYAKPIQLARHDFLSVLLPVRAARHAADAHPLAIDLSYLAFEYPQNLALQRFPVGKWMRCVGLQFSVRYER